MPQFDLPLAELRAYAPDLAEPADLDRFWATTLADARTHDLAATFTPIDTGLSAIDTLDVTFAGYGGRRSAAGSTSRPAGAGHSRPSSNTSATAAVAASPTSGSLWAAAGYAHLVMDTRGQGSDVGASATRRTRRDGAPRPIPGS